MRDPLSNEPSPGLVDLKVSVDSIRGEPAGQRAGRVLIEVVDRIIAQIRPVDSGERVDLDFPGYFAMPGLIDLHAHIGAGLSRYGVHRNGEDGVVALLSQGDAGWANLEEFVPTQGPTTLFALHVEPHGEVAVDAPDSPLQPEALASALEAESVWGVSVNLSRNSTGSRPPELVWETAVKAAEMTGAPLLFGPRRPEDWPLDQQLDLLRPGDVLTYLYRKAPYSLFSSKEASAATIRARDRGVVLDACHGSASLDFSAAEQASALGLLPTTVSSDLSTLCRDRETASLPHVTSKLIAAGLDEELVLDAASTKPAEVLGIDNRMIVGARANITIARWGPKATFYDTSGQRRRGPLLEIGATISEGRLLFSSSP